MTAGLYRVVIHLRDGTTKRTTASTARQPKQVQAWAFKKFRKLGVVAVDVLDLPS